MPAVGAAVLLAIVNGIALGVFLVLDSILSKKRGK